MINTVIRLIIAAILDWIQEFFDGFFATPSHNRSNSKFG